MDQRDQGLARLRAWTTGLVVTAGILVVLLASVAAATFPGSTAAAGDATSGATATPAQSGDDQASAPPAANQGIDQPQAPTGGFFGGFGRRGHAVSGGS